MGFDQLYLQIATDMVQSAGRANRNVTAVMRIFGKVARAVVVLSVAVSVHKRLWSEMVRLRINHQPCHKFSNRCRTNTESTTVNIPGYHRREEGPLVVSTLLTRILSYISAVMRRENPRLERLWSVPGSQVSKGASCIPFKVQGRWE